MGFKYTEDMIKKITEDAGYIYVDFERRPSGMIYVGFVCKKHMSKGTQYVLLNQLKNKKECCGACNGHNRTTEEFAEMVKEIHPNIEVIGEYTGARNKVDVRCTIHNHEWSPYAYNLLYGYGCEKCAKERSAKARNIDEDKKRRKLEAIHPDIEFFEMPYYARDNVKCKCKICGHEWYASYTNLTKDDPTSCPVCNNTSKGEKKIANLLDKWGYKYIRQKRYDDLKDQLPLPFDFYLNDFNVLIEFDGEQHFYPKGFGADQETTLIEFELTVKHDLMKDDYCRDNNISLVRIPYWEYDTIDYYLFDELTKIGVIDKIN